MPKYTTKYVKNLSTGEPFTFEVSDDTLKYFEDQKGLIEAGTAPVLGSIEDLTKIYEFSFFPAYRELLKIWTENGFTIELITQILREFGVEDSFIQKLLEDEEYTSRIIPWFEGITYDGGRASRTLAIVYKQTKSYYPAAS
jgi:DNA-binding transcriptional MerR regulator